MALGVFRSKVDVWLVFVIVGAFATIGVLLTPAGGSWTAPVAVCSAFGAGFVVLLYRSTSHTLSESELCVRSIGLRWQVPLRAIRAVTPTHNPLSSPALSLSRLRIDYGLSGFIMISPAARELLLRELEQRRAGV